MHIGDNFDLIVIYRWQHWIKDLNSRKMTNAKCGQSTNQSIRSTKSIFNLYIIYQTKVTPK